MGVLLAGLLLLSISYLVDGQQFRVDYTFDRSIEGWLKFHEIPAPWEEARLRCQLEGATLASPLTDALKTAILSKIKNKKTSCGLFTGIHATFSRGDYRSVEGVPLFKIPHEWADYEPDNEGGDENCILMTPDGNFADVNCSQSFQYTCYKKISPTVVMSSCGIVDHDYVFFNGTGHCYKFHKVPRLWSGANMACMAEGGYLAIINSQAEATFLKELFAKNPDSSMTGNFRKDNAFIGFHDLRQQSEWLTIDGQTLREAGFEKWANPQPNNLAPGQYCGSILRTGLLNDLWCDRVTPFICEKEPRSLLRDFDDRYRSDVPSTEKSIE